MADILRRHVLCYCIEYIHLIRKHSFVYLNMYILPNCHKIWFVIDNVHNLMGDNWQIESYSSWPSLHLRIRITGRIKRRIYVMVLSFKGLLQQMWSKLCDEIDVLDDHTQIASRAGERTRRKAQSDMKYRIKNRDKAYNARLTNHCTYNSRVGCTVKALYDMSTSWNRAGLKILFSCIYTPHLQLLSSKSVSFAFIFIYFFSFGYTLYIIVQ